MPVLLYIIYIFIGCSYILLTVLSVIDNHTGLTPASYELNVTIKNDSDESVDIISVWNHGQNRICSNLLN